MGQWDVMVVGGGGREHALGRRLVGSASTRKVWVCPGNAGTSTGGLESIPGDPLELARQLRPDLVVVGPEAPLCAGLADRLGALGFAVYGPTRAAAQLEGSKAFMKRFALRHGVRTARFHVVTDSADVARAVHDFERPPVIKADGLCAGKGVVVAETHAEAVSAAQHMLSGEPFGDAGKTVVIEERVLGAEASIHAICDGRTALMLPSAQDHKRIGDGDTGPNTGGMGTYAPAPLVTRALAERVRREMIEPIVAGMAQEGTPFSGTLFAGLMIDPTGEPTLLEINVRFGDPETQVLMALIEGDFTEVLLAAARGELGLDALSVNSQHALCVVLAAGGYPGTPRSGDEIFGLDAAGRIEGVQIYHSGTRLASDGRVLTNGGRVLGITGHGQTLAAARAQAYRAAESIQFSGMQYRRDIGHRALTPF